MESVLGVFGYWSGRSVESIHVLEVLGVLEGDRLSSVRVLRVLQRSSVLGVFIVLRCWSVGAEERRGYR